MGRSIIGSTRDGRADGPMMPWLEPEGTQTHAHVRICRRGGGRAAATCKACPARAAAAAGSSSRGPMGWRLPLIVDVGAAGPAAPALPWRRRPPPCLPVDWVDVLGRAGGGETDGVSRLTAS